MKLEEKDNLSLFATTSLPDIFFSEYLSQASGDFVKVYLCLIYLSKYKINISLSDLSKRLNLSLPIIQAALTFWEEHNLITKKLDGYIINNLQELELNRTYSPSLTLSEETVKKNESNKYRAKAIECINNTCFQGIMPLFWYDDINQWFEKYGFDEQVMISLFEYCHREICSS